MVELRGFKPLTPCMPYTACPHGHRCSEPSPLVNAEPRLPAGYLLSLAVPCFMPQTCPKGPLRNEASREVSSGLPDIRYHEGNQMG